MEASPKGACGDMHEIGCMSLGKAFDAEAVCREPVVSDEEGLAGEQHGQESFPEDTESFDTLFDVQVRMARLVI